MDPKLAEARKFWQDIAEEHPTGHPERIEAEARIAEIDALHERECARLEAEESRKNPNGQIICPHCAVKGKVRLISVTRKKGISGAKATGALLTGGVSMLLTGLSRKEKETEAVCSNCQAKWYL